MAAFSNPKLRIFNQSLTLLEYDVGEGTITNVVVSARGTSHLNRVGNGECTIKRQSGLNDRLTGDPLISKGNIAVAYVYDYIAAVDVAICCFTIEQIHEKTSPDGMSEIRFSGRDLLGELAGMKHFVDIGAAYSTTNTTRVIAGDEDVAVVSIGSLTTTVHPNVTSNVGDATVEVTSTAGWAVGDDIVIETNSSGVSHWTVIKGISGSEFQLDDQFTQAASPGNVVVKPEMWKGDSVTVVLDSGDIHTTRLENKPEALFIELLEAIPAGENVTIGNAVTVYSSHLATAQDATSADIVDIMQPAVDYFGWTTDLTAAGTISYGTEFGTSHGVDGPSTIQLLIKCNELSTEWFRWERAAANAPNRTLAWRKTSDSSGITLQMPTQANIEAAAVDTSKGIIRSLTAETRWRKATAVVPKGGTDDFDLGDRDTGSDTVGFTAQVWYGVWLVNNDASLDGNIDVHYVTFPDVKPISEGTNSKILAANELYDQAVAYLQANDAAEEFRQIETVLHADVLPGQTIITDYSETNWTESNTVYIVEVTNSIGRDGIRKTRLLTSKDSPYNRETAETRLVTATTSGGSITSSGSGGGGGGGGGVTDHGLLTGLTDDDHLQYLLTDGSRTLTGNMAVSALATIDGVDISVHAADADAHHDEATAGTDISLSGQIISVDATKNAYTNPAQTLTTDADGNLRLAGLTLGNTAIDDAHLQLHSDVDAYAHDYAAPGASAFTTGWKIDSGLGAAYFAYFEADQLHVRLFQADITMAKANGLIVTDSVAVLNADFVVPAVSSNVNIFIDDNPALGTAAVFANGDYVRFRYFKRSSGLSLFDVWGTVNTYTDQGDGTQRWNFITRSAAAGAIGQTIKAGAPAIGYGQTGQGWWEVDAATQDGNFVGGPYEQIGTWTTNPYTASNRALHYRAGNLTGILPDFVDATPANLAAVEWGIAVGTDISQDGAGATDDPFIIMSNKQATMKDVDLSIYDGADEMIRINPTVGFDIEVDLVAYGDDRGYTISKEGTVLGGMWHGWSAALSTLLVRNYTDETNQSGALRLQSYGAGTGVASVLISADPGTGETTNLDLYGGSSTPRVEIDQPLFIDRATGNEQIIVLKSDDVAHGVTTVAATDTFGYAVKVTAGTTGGGLALAGISEADIGVLLSGVATTADTTTNSNSDGTVELIGSYKSGTGITSLGATDNTVVMKNYTGAIWMLKGNGNTSQDGTMSDAVDFTPDFLDDVYAVRATMLLSPDAIRTKHDDDVPYTREDLEEIGLVNGKYRNRSMISETQSGAIWQLHQRIAELEKLLA